MWRSVAITWLLLWPVVAWADAPELSVEAIAERCRKSVAVVTVEGRDGKQRGIGAGFVVSKEGLIATNMHVIGEGRAIGVELHDGRKLPVVSIHATERSADLALIRVDAKDLTALELGDSDALKDGQSVVALGNPQGLKHSVVSGVVSGRRTIDGRSMIQLAIPLEPGNSGGPLVDRVGKVRGILTLKSAVTENLGFAMPINALKPLLAKPNPIPMAKWLTLGALDPADWTPVFGARWRQRAGRILVDGAGQGFGGRSLCLSNLPVADPPFEAAVHVKLADESGAAGLVFFSDGGDKHYGFYPSNGELRLTRFDGPDVFSWKILAQRKSEHYRPGDWNVLKVRFEKGKFLCFVNDRLLVESADDTYVNGKFGLAKFRDTEAEFKHFLIGKSVTSTTSNEAAQRILKIADRTVQSQANAAAAVEQLAKESLSPEVLRERAQQLDQQAAQFRKLAQEVHELRVMDELRKSLSVGEEQIDLAHAALLIAALDNHELDVASYRRELDRLGRKLGEIIGKNATDEVRLAALKRYFFEDRGFHGSRADYYHRSNSYLNEVIDDREGLPITLAVLFMELGRRNGLKFEGVGLPGHFVLRHVPTKGAPQLIDVFEGGAALTRDEAARKVAGTAGVELKDEHLKALDKRAIIVRMLHNLLNLARDDRDIPGALRYVNAIVEIDPDAGRERWMRAVIHFQLGNRAAARPDVEWLLDHSPEGVNLQQVRELQRLLNREP